MTDSVVCWWASVSTDAVFKQFVVAARFASAASEWSLESNVGHLAPVLPREASKLVIDAAVYLVLTCAMRVSDGGRRKTISKKLADVYFTRMRHGYPNLISHSSYFFWRRSLRRRQEHYVLTTSRVDRAHRQSQFRQERVVYKESKSASRAWKWFFEQLNEYRKILTLTSRTIQPGK